MKKHIHGGDVYHHENCIDFSANCNPLGTPESVKAAIRDSLEHVNDYPRVDCAPLREAIGRYEGVPAFQVICGNGAAELIFTLCRAVMPKKALVPAPTFAEYEQALQSVGCQVEHYFLSEKRNFRLEDRKINSKSDYQNADPQKDSMRFLSSDKQENNERFCYEDMLTDSLDMVFLCNPNNPTGILTDRNFLLQILKRCRECGILLVVDECFLDFVKEPEAYTLKAALVDYPNLFLLKAFTKRYAMAGVRLGYGLCSNKELLEKMEAVTQPWNVSSLAQAAGIAALGETEYVEAGRKLIFQEAFYLKENMGKLGLKVYPSQANYLFFKGPKGFAEKCAARGILIRDCSNYEGLEPGYYRIAVKLHEQNEKLLQVFAECLTS